MAGGYPIWNNDLYGVGETLREKRLGRGWTEGKEKLIAEGCDDNVRQLLTWRGGESGVEIFSGRLPWDDDSTGGRT